MEWVLGVLAGLTIAAVIWAWRPIRNRLERSKPRVAIDHGIVWRVYRTPDEMTALSPEQLLHTEPDYLVNENFYLSATAPPDDPKANEAMWQWARRHNGQDIFVSHVLLILQATQDRTVVLRPPAVDQQIFALKAGAVFGPEGLGGNGLLVRRFYVNLDAGRATAKYIDKSSNEPGSSLFKMVKGDSEAILVIAETHRDRHEWKLRLPLQVDGHEVTLTIDNDGEPFVTVGPAGLPRWMWVSDERRWMRTPNHPLR